jgi:hypothetical protein
MPDPTWPCYPLAFIHDAARCLALAHQGHLSFDARGRLRARSISRLAGVLSLQPATSPPRSETQSPPLSFLFGLLGQAGLMGNVEDRLRVTATAYDWLDLPASLQVGALRQVWWAGPDLNVCWLRSPHRQHPLKSYWKRVVLATCEWVTGLSPSHWTCIPEGESYLVELPALQLADKAGNLPSVRQARHRRLALVVRFLLSFVLPVLGLVEASAPLFGLDEVDQELKIRPTIAHHLRRHPGPPHPPPRPSLAPRDPPGSAVPGRLLPHAPG